MRSGATILSHGGSPAVVKGTKLDLSSSWVVGEQLGSGGFGRVYELTGGEPAAGCHPRRRQGRPDWIVDRNDASVSPGRGRAVAPRRQGGVRQDRRRVLGAGHARFLTSPPEASPVTATALSDPHIAQAVQLLHTEPAHPWSVGQLAYRVGMSRSAFNDRFRDLVGEPPMRYLTRSRLTQAAGYLATSDRTLDDIARRCGYDSGAALSKAFKREHAMTPGAYRAAASRQPVIDVSA